MHERSTCLADDGCPDCVPVSQKPPPLLETALNACTWCGEPDTTGSVPCCEGCTKMLVATEPADIDLGRVSKRLASVLRRSAADGFGRDSSLNHEPTRPWTFDGDVTRCFEDMLERSIPGYQDMRTLVRTVAEDSFDDGDLVVDLGSSKGGAIADMAAQRPGVEFWAIEHAPAMLAALRSRFAISPNVKVIDRDLAVASRAVPKRKATVVLAVLTLQFLPVAARKRVLEDARLALKMGGVLIVVEKVRGSSPGFEMDFQLRHRRMKLANGYTKEAIDRKKMSLEGILEPLSAAENEAMIREAGFPEVECFWRSLNFAAWAAY